MHNEVWGCAETLQRRFDLFPRGNGETTSDSLTAPLTELEKEVIM